MPVETDSTTEVLSPSPRNEQIRYFVMIAAPGIIPSSLAGIIESIFREDLLSVDVSREEGVVFKLKFSSNSYRRSMLDNLLAQMETVTKVFLADEDDRSTDIVMCKIHDAANVDKDIGMYMSGLVPMRLLMEEDSYTLYCSAAKIAEYHMTEEQVIVKDIIIVNRSIRM